MADASRVQLYYLAENAWGTPPPAALAELRFTGEALGYSIDTTTSNEVRSDRQVPDLIRTGASASGNVDIELSYGAYDPLIAGALFDTWSDDLAIAATDDIAASNAGSSFTSVATDFAAAGVAVGQWIRVGGFTAGGGANNGWYRVTGVATNAIGVAPAPTSDEAATGLEVTIAGSMLRNGTTETSFTLEKRFSDIGQYLALTGMVANTFSLTVRAGAVLTGSFGFTGKAATLSGSTVGTGAPVTAPANPVMNAVTDVGGLSEGGMPMTGVFVQSLSLQLNNNVRPIGAVGTFGSADLGVGRCGVSGGLSVYFADGALYQKFVAGTATGLSFRLTDQTGNAYVVTLPHLKLTSGAIAAGSADTDVLADFQYQALRDPATGATLQFDRFAA